MIHENKYIQASIEEDELSTSVGSSDNEIEDDETPLPSPSKQSLDPSMGKMTPHARDLCPNTVLAAQAFLVVTALLEMLPLLPCAFLSVALLGINTKPQQPKASSTKTSSVRTGTSIPSARPQPQTRKVAKTSEAQRQPVAPPPGLSLPRREAKGSFVKQAVAPPPGLSLERCEAEEIAPPPGLGLAVQAMRTPPGLEAISPPPGLMAPPGLQALAPPPGLSTHIEGAKPPGIFFKDAPSVRSAPLTEAQRRTRRRKQASATVAPAQVMSTECPTPLCPKPVPPPPVTPREFDQAIYRKELSDVLRELATGNNVAVAVRRIRVQNVPRERQAQEFCDILTRAAEENRGVVRRLSFAFATGLASGEPSAFAREECLAGVKLFFEEVFEDLASEVPRLRNKLANELVPTLRTVFSGEEITRLLPHDCRPVQC